MADTSSNLEITACVDLDGCIETSGKLIRIGRIAFKETKECLGECILGKALSHNVHTASSAAERLHLPQTNLIDSAAEKINTNVGSSCTLSKSVVELDCCSAVRSIALCNI